MKVAIVDIHVLRIEEVDSDGSQKLEPDNRIFIAAKGLGFLNPSLEKRGVEAAAVKLTGWDYE